MIKIRFEGGISRDGIHGCNYMIGQLEDGSELYAEEIAPSDMDENEAEYFGYDKLKAEIIRQAAGYGLSESDLDFD